jgi:hypothetical protein
MRAFRTGSVLSAFLCAGLTACQAPADITQLSSSEPEHLPKTAVKSRFDYNMAKVSCDPLGGGQPIYYNEGLAAELHALPSPSPTASPTGELSQPRNLAEIFASSQKVDVDLFFSQVNVPTRLFSSGFPSATGVLLRDQQNQVLTEYFALRFKSILRLGSGERSGLYQFAVLSDDGAVLKLDTDGNGLKTVVDNDGWHPSRFACGTEAVSLDTSSLIPLQLEYFQGPKYHISLVLLWRELPLNATSAQFADSACGITSNDRWFDYSTTPPTPKTAWTGILSRGWKVLGHENFVLPYEQPENPCCPGCDIGV